MFQSKRPAHRQRFAGIDLLAAALSPVDFPSDTFLMLADAPPSKAYWASVATQVQRRLCSRQISYREVGYWADSFRSDANMVAMAPPQGRAPHGTGYHAKTSLPVVSSRLLRGRRTKKRDDTPMRHWNSTTLRAW